MNQWSDCNVELRQLLADRPVPLMLVKKVGVR